MPRINKSIELLEQDQPVYLDIHYGIDTDHPFEDGVRAAHTWADLIDVDLERSFFDVPVLAEFMRGLAAAGPTATGHRTPAVYVTLPIAGTSEASIWANAWMIWQVLNTGVHGIMLCQAESAEAVRAFVEAVRYPFHTIGEGDKLGEGRRGHSGEHTAAPIWGLSIDEYLRSADVWPLNPRGEIMLGLKLENKHALANAEAVTNVPGIAFAEWGPGDMRWSLLRSIPRPGEPRPPELLAARARIFAACKANHIAFLDGVVADNVTARIDEGVRVCPVAPREAGPTVVEIGRKHTRHSL